MSNLKLLIPKPNVELTDYNKRSIANAKKWVEGNPEHNHVDNECCLDFSCCNPSSYNEDPIIRLKIFWSWYNRLFNIVELPDVKSNRL